MCMHVSTYKLLSLIILRYYVFWVASIFLEYGKYVYACLGLISYEIDELGCHSL